jgi:hypothetical protein
VQLALCAHCFLRAATFFSLARRPPVFSSASPSLPRLLARPVNRSLVTMQSSSLELSYWPRAQPSYPGFRALLVPSSAPCARYLSPMTVCRSTPASFPQSQLVVLPCAHAARSRVPMLAVASSCSCHDYLPAPCHALASSDFIVRSLVRHRVLLHGWLMLLHRFALAAHMAGVFFLRRACSVILCFDFAPQSFPARVELPC